MKNTFKLSVALLVVITSLAFTGVRTKTIPQKEGEWISLFDGKTLKGWHGYNKTGPVSNWEIEDGALVCLGAAKNAAGGDIITDKKFTDFELKWEWKVNKGSNSGVMY